MTKTVRRWTRAAENLIQTVGLRAAFDSVEHELDQVNSNLTKLDELLALAQSQGEVENLRSVRHQQEQRKERLLVARGCVYDAYQVNSLVNDTIH